MSRKIIHDVDDITSAMRSVRDKIGQRLNAKGSHIFISSHEILGVIEEECDELKEAVRANDHNSLRNELIDVAVGAIWGIISIDSGDMDW